MKHAKKFQSALENLNKTNFPMFLAVNLAKEPTKTGVSLDEIDDLVLYINENCPNIQIMGLMSIPPKDCDDRKSLYSELRKKM